MFIKIWHTTSTVWMWDMYKVNINRNEESALDAAGLHFLLLIEASAAAAAASAFNFSSLCSKKTLYSSAERLRKEIKKEPWHSVYLNSTYRKIQPTVKNKRTVKRQNRWCYVRSYIIQQNGDLKLNKSGQHVPSGDGAVFKSRNIYLTISATLTLKSFWRRLPQSKSNGFFLDSPQCSSAQQPSREKSIVKQAEIPISPLTALSINHNALHPQDMLSFKWGGEMDSGKSTISLTEVETEAAGWEDVGVLEYQTQTIEFCAYHKC